MVDPKKLQFDVKKDPIDLRDKMYEGSLIELPPWVDNRSKIPFVLNQDNEGACTGFGLAAIINYLLANKIIKSTELPPGPLKREDGASSRMLYELAKRYDEWEGEDYEGSSIRGAMKGWFKHGVCREKMWPYKPGSKDNRITSERLLDALKRCLGNYYRVRHLHLSEMHSALSEVGIVYASASVHSGWFDVDSETGKIPLRYDNLGGHAFAIVGYDREGFWIQNSWGEDWGYNGFAHISYDDWFENSYDCWIARMAVPTTSLALKSGGVLAGRVLSFDYVPHHEVVFADIQPHMVNFDNDGRLSNSGRYQTSEKDVDKIVYQHILEQTQNWSGTPRLVIYAHGGLNDEEASASRIASMKPYFLKNEIYPIHFMWETGLWDSVTDIVKDAIRSPRFGGRGQLVKDRFADLLDEGIELAARGLGRPVWNQMKNNAECASDYGGGADLLAGKLAQYQLDGNQFELHLVGHSAGSILLAHLIPELERWGLTVKSCTLYAPACTVALFESHIAPYFGSGNCIEKLSVFNLTDAAERDDTVKIYRKSLLYLVSESFEQKPHTELLGMEKFGGLKKTLGTPATMSPSTVVYSKGGPTILLDSTSTTHGGFDNDVPTLNSTLRIIRGTNTLIKSFQDS
tara:strand:- start:505 stop:2394 length:1890 start_codon:yes stop_codon:yes gene_type:complete